MRTRSTSPLHAAVAQLDAVELAPTDEGLGDRLPLRPRVRPDDQGALRDRLFELGLEVRREFRFLPDEVDHEIARVRDRSLGVMLRELDAAHHHDSKLLGDRKRASVAALAVIRDRDVLILDVIGQRQDVESVPPGLDHPHLGRDQAIGIKSMDVEIPLENLESLDRRKDDLFAGKLRKGERVGPALELGPVGVTRGLLSRRRREQEH